MSQTTCLSKIFLIIAFILFISCESRNERPVPMKTVFVVEKVYTESEVDGVSVYKIKILNSMYQDEDIRVVDSINKYKAGDVVDFYKR